MVNGLGVDIVRIERIKKLIENANFLERCFSAPERAYFATKGYKPETIAGLFAAKEAFSKAIGTGIRDFKLADVQILHTDLGKPYLALIGTAQIAAAENGFGDFHLSISHDGDYAIATVIAHRAGAMKRIFAYTKQLLRRLFSQLLVNKQQAPQRHPCNADDNK